MRSYAGVHPRSMHLAPEKQRSPISEPPPEDRAWICCDRNLPVAGQGRIVSPATESATALGVVGVAGGLLLPFAQLCLVGVADVAEPGSARAVFATIDAAPHVQLLTTASAEASCGSQLAPCSGGDLARDLIQEAVEDCR